MMEGKGRRQQMTAILPRRGGESVPRPRVPRVCVPLCACVGVRVLVPCKTMWMRAHAYVMKSSKGLERR
jgi:hypothetical protein